MRARGRVASTKCPHGLICPPRCGRFAAQLPPEFIRRLFTTKGELPNLGLNWIVAPTQPAMVIRRHPDTAKRRLDVL